jgi:hypothetical protein
VNAKAEPNDSSSVVYLSEELVPLLEFAYFALPKKRQEAVEVDLKEHPELSREQAIFNEIVTQRIKMYAKGGEKLKDLEVSKALRVLRSLGMSEDEIQTKLKRIK